MSTFKLDDKVRKKSGAKWQGVVVGTYSTELTPEGYAVESDAHPGSVQIYPVSALEPAPVVLRAERAKLVRVLEAAVALVCAPAWAGVSDEDVTLERVLHDCGFVPARKETQ